jgi:hypothetical protein
MKITNKLIILLFIVKMLPVNAQEFAAIDELNYTSAKKVMPTSKPLMEYRVLSYKEMLERITPEMAGNHFLGADIARQYYLFNDLYTYEVPVSPGNPANKTMVEKPSIYSAVRKIEKQIRKDLKSKKIDKDSAQAKFRDVLDVAISTYYSDTNLLEDAIQNAGSSNELTEIFTEGVILIRID